MEVGREGGKEGGIREQGVEGRGKRKQGGREGGREGGNKRWRGEEGRVEGGGVGIKWGGTSC